MRRLLASFFLLSVSALAQTTIAPDCRWPFVFTATGSSGALDNRGSTCNSFTVNYESSGFSALSLVVQSANGANTPAAFATYTGSVSTGINPNTATTTAQTTLTGFVPWLQVTLTSTTGTGTIRGVVYGYRTGYTGAGGPAASVNVLQVGSNAVATGGVNGLLAVAGPAASGATQTGNPVKIGGPFNTTQPTVTTGQAVDAQMTARGAVIVATGVDQFVVNGAAASGATNTGNPVKEGAVFNTTQPTVTTGQVVDVQATARGAQIVATGVDPFSVAIAANSSFNLNQVAGGAVATGGVSGLLAVAGPAASGATQTGNPVKIGGPFNTTQPTVTTGQAVDAQMTARGAVIVATGVDAFVVNGAAASGATNTGNPVKEGAVFNTTQPTVTTGQVVDVQATARGGQIVATGVDAFTVQPGNTPNTTAWLTTEALNTTLGATPFLANALTNSAVTVKGSAGVLYGYYCLNPAAANTYIQIYDTSGAVTVGATTPVLSLGIPASANGPGGANLSIAGGVHFTNAIKVAATTTATGAGAPVTAADCNFWFK